MTGATTLKMLALMAAAALVWAAPARADGSESANDGAVTATLAWGGDELDAQDATLTIVRGGGRVPAFAAKIPDVCGIGCKLAGEGDVQVTDLDGDGEPEVVVTGFTGGQGCCTIMGVYDFRPATGGYGAFVQDWRGSGFELAFADNDNREDIETGDIRFEGLFSSQAASFPPPAVFDYERPGGVPRLVDITRKFPVLIKHNASEAKRHLSHFHRGDADAGGYTAAYVADQYLIGHGSTGLKELDRQIARGVLGTPKAAKAYRARLLKLLHRYGYR
jgi:hypothetical protein